MFAPKIEPTTRPAVESLEHAAYARGNVRGLVEALHDDPRLVLDHPPTRDVRREALSSVDEDQVCARPNAYLLWQSR